MGFVQVEFYICNILCIRRQYIFFDIYVSLFGHLFNIFCEIDSDTRRRYYLLYVSDVEYNRMRPTEKCLHIVQYLVIAFFKNNFNCYIFSFYQKIKYTILSVRHNNIISKYTIINFT